MVRQKEKESEKQAKLREDLNLEKQLKFADHIENIQDTEARLVISSFCGMGNSRSFDHKTTASKFLNIILSFYPLS